MDGDDGSSVVSLDVVIRSGARETAQSEDRERKEHEEEGTKRA